MPDSTSQELIQLCQRLLDAIDTRNWAVYSELCDPSLTAFEPEAVGHIVRGLEFHHYYFKMPPSERPVRSTICEPDVRLMGETAVVCYVRLTQRITEDGRGTTTTAGEETRVWQRKDGRWRHVHFHRSPCGDVRL